MSNLNVMHNTCEYKNLYCLSKAFRFLFNNTILHIMVKTRKLL